MGEEQEKDLRYKLEHLGDVVVEMIEGFGCSISGGFRGIWLTRHINAAQRARNNVVYRIGERVVSIRKEQAALFGEDEPMTVLFSEFDGAEHELDAMISEREERLDRLRGKIKAAVNVMKTDEIREDMGWAVPA